MSVLETIAAARQLFVDGIDANKGAINLDIFEDFYPDEAHFIYELLQNAEDAGAIEVYFELNPHGCVFEHNGTRHFGEDDIDSITGIHSSTKKVEPDKIGKFGVGFKSVFVYTETPVIYSKNFSFRILKRFIPKSVQPKPSLGERTRFEFPFDNPRKNVEQAYMEVKSGLEQLSETTLLFLKNLRYISWKIDNLEGAVLREDHSDFHVEVLKQLDGKDVFSSHWLRFQTSVQNLQQFTAPVAGIDQHKVAVAFELAFIGDQKSFDKALPIAKQLKIVPAAIGKVSIFFPADKETSGLRFHLHAPFVPELSRASIKNSSENAPLFEQIAKLSARSLHFVKDMGLLTSDFLGVLPNNDDHLPDRYQIIRAAILSEMREQPLTPTQARGYAPSKTLLQARATMKELLSDEDIAFLLTRGDGATWSIGAIRSTNQERFLNSLDIVRWDVDSLADYLDQYTCNSDARWNGPNLRVMAWLSSKPDEWHQLLYSMLYTYCEESTRSERLPRVRVVKYEQLRDSKIIRLEGGGYQSARSAYFSSGGVVNGDPFSRVSENVLTIGARKVQQEQAKKFLEKIGVREPGETEEISLLLRTRYAEEGVAPKETVYLADLRRFISYMEKNENNKLMFRKACLFRIESKKYEWASASEIYLDAPFKSTSLSAYYSALSSEEEQKFPLAKWYETSGVDLKKLATFCEWAGGSSTFLEFVSEVSCRENPKYSFLVQVPGERYTSWINRDHALNKSIPALLAGKNEALSRLVWSTMCRLPTHFLKACYQKNEKNGCREEASQLVHQLKNIAWIPLNSGQYVTPLQATRRALLPGFTFDEGYKWLEAVEFESVERAQSAETATKTANWAKVGVKSKEDVQFIEELLKLPASERKRMLDESEARQSSQSEGFPDAPIRNRDTRNQRVREEAAQTPKKRYEERLRSVAVDVDPAKEDAKAYLRAQYTSNRVMHCQVCKGEMPFKQRNGEYYFEAVEISDAIGKRLRQTFLALCPNHAAMFKHANDPEKDMLESVATSSGREIEVVLGGKPTTIQFTATHLADMKACLEASQVG
jgi:hypothetical protein